MQRMDRREFLRRTGRVALGASTLPLVAACTQSPPAPSPTHALPTVTPPTGSLSPSVAGPVTPAEWQSFTQSQTGPVLRPGQSGYVTAKQLFQPRFDSAHPQAVVECASVADVQRAIAFARAHAIPIAPRSGGHSYAGYSTGPGMVIDVGKLSRITVNRAHGTVTVGAGARLIDIYSAVAAAGVAIPGGTCPTVGIAGLALGGGQGVVGRKLGLTCDAMTSVQVVMADGKVLNCDAHHNPDLFWACRGGGGGNFGIVTSFTFATHPLTSLVTFTLDWPWADAHEGPARLAALGAYRPRRPVVGLSPVVESGRGPPCR